MAISFVNFLVVDKQFLIQDISIQRSSSVEILNASSRESCYSLCSVLQLMKIFGSKRLELKLFVYYEKVHKQYHLQNSDNWCWQQSCKSKLLSGFDLPSVGGHLRIHSSGNVYILMLIHTQSDNKPLYNFTVEFIRKTSSYIEPYIHLVRPSALICYCYSNTYVHLYFTPHKSCFHLSWLCSCVHGVLWFCSSSTRCWWQGRLLRVRWLSISMTLSWSCMPLTPLSSYQSCLS